MKTCCVSILVVLFLAIGLANAQSLPENSPSTGDSSNARELVKPVGNKVSKSTQPAGAPELTLPFAMFEPPKRFLWGDIDNDGLKDLFVLDFRGNILFRNLGNGGFEDMTAAAFPDGAGAGVTGFWGDYDGDTLTDLFLFHGEGFTLFRNDGKLRFSDVTESLGMDKGLPVSNAQLEDFDGDGFGDLILETPEGDRIFRNQEGRAFGEVDLPEPDRGRGGTFTTGWPPKTPNKKLGPMGGYSAPGSGPTGPEMMIGLDGRYVNDNSPGSVGVGIPEVEGGNDATTLNDIVDGTITGSDVGLPLTLEGSVVGSVFASKNTDNGNLSSGIYGECLTDHGAGIFGVGHIGVKGQGDGDGAGVYGVSQEISGEAFGVFGTTLSSEGHGVHGYAALTSGENAGVYGLSLSSSGYGVQGEGPKYGVYGIATAPSDWCWGVRGDIEGEKGHGVGGYATSLTGNVFGVLGRSYSEIGKGVYGYASASTGENYGVLGQTNSTEGYGVYGEAKASSGTTYGVYGISNSQSGFGIYGLNDSTGGVGIIGIANGNSGYTYGVQGYCYSSNGRAVNGNSNGPSGVNYGVRGYSASSSGYGMYSSGNFGCSGTKSFVQPHPSDPSKEIHFVCLEGNESGTYFRGTARLEAGRTVIEVPEAFRLVTEEEGLTVQVTPMGLVRVGVEEKSLNRIVVIGEADVTFDYFVNGVRKGFAEFEPIRENHEWVPEYRDRAFGTQYPEALRRILVENGILNSDFTPNKKTAAQLGWELRSYEEEHARFVGAKEE